MRKGNDLTNITPASSGQVRLAAEQVEAFYHADFVADQTRDFLNLLGPSDGKLVLDIGGGCGYFARRIAQNGYPVRVLDLDAVSVETCRQQGLDARLGDALRPGVEGDEGTVSLNLILHHLVGPSERETRLLQVRALKVWQSRSVRIFVNEYIYESFVGRISPRLIYEITSSRILSRIGSLIGRIIPAFRANTFGVGVRFRSHAQWRELFAEAGFKVVDVQIGKAEPVALPLRALLIKEIRRDSFLIENA